MDKKKTLKFGILVFIGMFIWAATSSNIVAFLLPNADMLTIYLFDKGLFVVLLLAVISKFGGVKFFGFERGRSWWFLLPGMPLLLLGVLVLFAPNATFDLSVAAMIGWFLVAFLIGIGEETVFRGVLWRAFESTGPIFTAIATSFLFGAIHLIGLFTDIPWQIILSLAVFASGVGMMLAAVRIVSGSLLAPIALHTIFDAGALIAAGGATEMFDETWTVERLLGPGTVFGIWGLVCVLVVNKWRSHGRSKTYTDSLPMNESSANDNIQLPV